MTHLARITGILAMAATAVAAEVTQEVYVFTGEHGEVVFSDEAVPGAERIEVTAIEPPAGAGAELEARIEQTLRVADALEESRLARERTRAEARARAADQQAAAAPQVIYQDRYVTHPYVFRAPFDRRFDRHGREAFRHRDRFDRFPHGKRDGREGSRERSRSRAFPYDSD